MNKDLLYSKSSKSSDTKGSSLEQGKTIKPYDSDTTSLKNSF